MRGVIWVTQGYVNCVWQGTGVIQVGRTQNPCSFHHKRLLWKLIVEQAPALQKELYSYSFNAQPSSF